MRKKTLPLLIALAVAASPVTLSTPAFARSEAMTNQDWWPNKLDLS